MANGSVGLALVAALGLLEEGVADPLAETTTGACTVENYTDSRAGRNGLIDSATASAVQFRKKAIYAITCSYPGANGVIQTA